jgi:hypothetical protein
MLPLGGENRWYVEQPKRLSHRKFKVDVARDRGQIRRVSGKDEYLLPSDLADYIMRLFLDYWTELIVGKLRGHALDSAVARADAVDAVHSLHRDIQGWSIRT